MKPHNNCVGEEMQPPGSSLVEMEESCFACTRLGTANNIVQHEDFIFHDAYETIF